MDYETFVDDLEDAMDLWSRQKVESVAKTVLEVLGETLSTSERTWMASHLDEPLDDALTRTWGDQDIDMAEFVDRLSHREGLVEEFVAQQARVVCQTLADHLDAEVLVYLTRHVPPTFVSLFQADN